MVWLPTPENIRLPKYHHHDWPLVISPYCFIPFASNIWNGSEFYFSFLKKWSNKPNSHKTQNFSQFMLWIVLKKKIMLKYFLLFFFFLKFSSQSKISAFQWLYVFVFWTLPIHYFSPDLVEICPENPRHPHKTWQYVFTEVVELRNGYSNQIPVVFHFLVTKGWVCTNVVFKNIRDMNCDALGELVWKDPLYCVKKPQCWGYVCAAQI